MEKVSIYLTLKKIRTNHTFAELADDFGISESYASKLFSQAVIVIGAIIKQLINWPSRQSIKNQLPLSFRTNFSNVESIIDCSEIEIQKPTDAIKQSMAWSEYKKANTLKYLISTTPDGIINFISTGFGGRISDVAIVEESGFLDCIKEGCCVMADRGFKNIETVLLQKKCKFFRPPSTTSNKKFNKEEALKTKRIASIRIHVERVIRHVREFKMLRPHSCVNHKLIPYMDHAINVACGLINMQEHLIKN